MGNFFPRVIIADTIFRCRCSSQVSKVSIMYVVPIKRMSSVATESASTMAYGVLANVILQVFMYVNPLIFNSFQVRSRCT